MKKIEKNIEWKILICKYGILIVQVIVMIWLCSIKPAINEDEIWTYFISNRFSETQDITIESLNEWTSADVINEVMWTGPGHRFDYSFVKNYASFDVHPPLYNILLHTVCSFFYNFGFSLWYGYALNILFIIISYLLIYKTSKFIFNSDIISLLLSSIYGFSIGTYNTLCFTRFYGLAALFVINALYLHLKAYKEHSNLNYIGIIINTCLGMLTFYPFGVYQFFLSIIFLVMLIIKKDYILLRRYLMSLILSGIIFLMIFPQSIYQVLYGTPGSGFRDLNRNYFIDLKLFLQIISKELFGNKLIIIGVVLGGALLYYCLKKIKRWFDKDFSLMIYIPVIGYLLIINHMAPFNTTGRYHSIIYPILIIAVYGTLVYLISVIGDIWIKKERFKGQILTIIMCSVFVPVISFYIKENPLYNVEYLLYGVKSYNEIADAYKETECVCVFDDNPLKLYINYGELKEFNDIYFTNQTLLLESNDNRLKEADDLIIYITQGLDEQKIIEKLMSQNNKLNNAELIYQWRYADVIYLSSK